MMHESFFTFDAFVVEHGCDSHNDSDFLYLKSVLYHHFFDTYNFFFKHWRPPLLVLTNNN